MCHEASRALVKCSKVKEAVDCCVALNQWDRAVEIAHEHNMSSVDELLAKYASHLLEKGLCDVFFGESTCNLLRHFRLYKHKGFL